MSDSEEINYKLLAGESGPVTTYCRFRTFLKSETDVDKKMQCSVAFHKKGKNVLLKFGVERPIKFDFERVFPMSTSQDNMFQHVGRQAVAEIVHGHNAVVVSLGGPKSGKTYTLLGDLDWNEVCYHLLIKPNPVVRN
jgi:hypothetical protein